MISRRILRIKSLQTIYSYYQSSDKSINKAETELFNSIEKTYDLYYYLLMLINEVIKYADSRIELAKQKLIPTEEDLNPNTRFIDNKLAVQIFENEQFKLHVESKKLNWANHPELIKKLYNELLETEYYKRYMLQDSNSYADDKNILIYFFEEIVYNCELLYQILEEKSIYWSDTVEFIISMVVKTLNKYKIGYIQTFPLLSMFKNDDDREFVKTLFRKTILNHQDYIQLIKDNTRNWDVDRIAYIDILIIQQAIAEILEFKEVPISVSFNEYLEIAKLYSTKKSSTFINGILDKIIKKLKSEDKITKIGRGLVDKKYYPKK